MPKARYDDIAQYYEGVIDVFERWMLPGLRRKALQLLPEDACILEVGAGTGLNFAFYPRDVRGVAGEISGEMLKIARTKAKPVGVSLVQNCAESLPFNDATFTAAFATLVFCSVSSPARALSELRRVVAPGGTVVLLEHVRPNGLLGFVFDVMNFFTVRLFEDHVNRRTLRLAVEAGFEVVSVEQTRLGIINLIVCRA